MSRVPHLIFVVAWSGLALASASAHSEAIKRDWPHTGNGSVTVDNALGRVDVIGWAEPRVQLRGELSPRANLLVKSASNTRLQLAVVVDDHASRGDAGSRLVLHVPHGVALTVTSVSADIGVRGMRSAPMVAINTVSGDQMLAFSAGAARLKSVSGDLNISGASPRSSLATISGNVELHDFVGGADVSVVSGDVRVRDARLALLDIENVSGDIEVMAAPLVDALWRFESLGGDIDIKLPVHDRIAIAADTFSGSIDADIGSAHDTGTAGSRKRGSTLRLDPPGSNARIIIDTFSGDIRLSRIP